MRYRYSFIIFLALIFVTVLTTAGNAAVKLYLYPPGPAYFSSLNVGDSFTVEIAAEAADPGVTLFTFMMAWLPGSSVEFVRPANSGSQELVMTGFFPSSTPDFSRLSGIAPDWTSESAMGMPGTTPEITVYTAPAGNYAGMDLLAKITLRKLSTFYPSFNMINAKAFRHLGGSESAQEAVTFQTAYSGADVVQAVMAGTKPSQANLVTVNIGGRNYSANVAGNAWLLDIVNVKPNLSAQPVTITAMKNGAPLISVTTMDIIRSPGWFESQLDHSEQPGDADGDGDTDLSDLMKFRPCYGSSLGDSQYDFRCDYNANGVVNLVDLLILGLYYGN